MKRPPDEVIGPVDNPYMRRWWLFKPRGWFKRWLPVIYLHNVLRSDNARALHDHVGWNISILLKGLYKELMPGSPHLRPHLRMKPIYFSFAIRKRGSIVFRRATSLHSLQLIDGQPVWTIWIRGPWSREWGFMDPDPARGWISHYHYDREA